MNPSKLQKDDRVNFDHDGLSGCTFRVSDVEVQDVGITEVVAVGLVCGCDTYALTGATADSQFTVEHRDTGEAWQVFKQQIEVES